MKALCWEGVNDIRYETVPDPKSNMDATRSSRSRAAPFVGRTCIFRTGLCPA